jgi:4-hydroxyphenylpyruvate dioxygenase
VFNDDFRAAPGRFVARDGLRSLILIEADASDGAGLPAVPILDGIEFLEFAVDEKTGPELVTYLQMLGFRLAGRHRSKAVDLYRNGGVNLVLNAEQDSAASEHFHLHGPSVCAMAIRVDDAARAQARARALLCPDWQEPIGTGERRIPAVRAPDGTLLYLVQQEPGKRSFWEDDFELLPGSDEAASLLEIDHVVLALPAGRMASHVLFWRALFGLIPQPQLDTADPYGLVHSRALVSPNGKVRIVLNASEGRGTLTGRFVSAYAGAGVHHVALATPDIVRMAQDLEIRHVPLLPMPSNYYDDLAARWELNDPTLHELREHGLLYDRDGNGEFRHLYTESFHDRFFFEFVRRQAGYAGFGAANASVRTAAQARKSPGATYML